MPVRYGLSKSRIAAFEQCPKRLWLSVHAPDHATMNKGVQARFAAGHAVGDLACSLVPDGVMVEADPDLAAALATTAALISAPSHVPIFEATFVHDGVLVRVDILEPDDAGGWSVAEVKSTTRAKAQHTGDLATQLWVMRQTGLSVSTASIRHIDSRFVLATTGDYDGLFTDTPIDEAALASVRDRAEVVADARAMLAGSEPVRETGAHCDTPYPCDFRNYCDRGRPPPPDWPVSQLPGTGRTLGESWGAAGIFDLRDMPAGALTAVRHERIRDCVVSDRIFHDLAGALADTADWTYPRTFLDFETMNFAIPRWVGTRPYAQVPFQFSAHVENADGTMTHVDFLDIDGGDPRPGIARALSALPDTGAVIAYNAAFEKRCLIDLADAVPVHTIALTSLADRLVDLLPVTRTRYYHRDQRGSWSIKAVLPTLGTISYADLIDVADGLAAQSAYIEATHIDTSDLRREALRTALLAYCRRDTEAMIVLLNVLIGKPATLSGKTIQPSD